MQSGHHDGADGRQRIFERDGVWFFRARGGRDVGPYRDRAAAERALRAFVRRCRGPERSGPVRLVARLLGRAA